MKIYIFEQKCTRFQVVPVCYNTTKHESILRVVHAIALKQISHTFLNNLTTHNISKIYLKYNFSRSILFIQLIS